MDGDDDLRRRRHQYRESEAIDAIVLDSTTGCFLDNPNDAAATAARRAALLEFIRGGKGIAGLHAASDSYHGSSCSGGGAPGGVPPAGRGAQGGGRGGGAATPYVAALFVQGDKDEQRRDIGRGAAAAAASATLRATPCGGHASWGRRHRYTMTRGTNRSPRGGRRSPCRRG